ncbi:MAG: thioredoxin [bacterium]|nr:thioredoxin [bacterium]
MSNAVEITDATFEEEVLNSEIPVMIDFWAEWCAPCKMIAPAIDEIAKEYEGKIKVGKVDVDNNPTISMKYQIRSIPSLLVFKDGNVATQLVGAVPKPQIKNMIEGILS